MKNWSVSTKVTVALVIALLIWVIGRSVMYSRMARTIAHQAATKEAVSAARSLILSRKMARVFKDGTDHAKYQAIRTSQVFANDYTTVEIEGHHMTMAEAAAGAMVEFLTDLELPVRACAAEALGRMGKSAAKPLIDGALNSPDRDVRSNATKALTQIGAVAVPEMIETVKNGKPSQKIGVANALGQLRSPRAIPALIGALSVKEADVRMACRDALVVMKQAAVPQLIGALADKSPFTRRHSAEALGEIGDAGAAAPLLKVFDDEHRLVRLAAVFAVGKLKQPIPRIATEPLLRKLEDRDRELREGAAVSLGQVADPAAVPRLIAAMSDPIEAVREQAAGSLGRIQPRDGGQLAQIENLAGAGDVGVRLAAVLALGRIGNARALPTVLRRLQPSIEADPKVRRRAAEAIGQIGSGSAVSAGEVVPALVQSFSDGDWRVNYEAQKALAKLGAKAVPPLIAVLQSGDPLPASYARHALAKMERAPLAELKSALQTPQAKVRVAVALTLAEMRNEEGYTELAKLAENDGDETVKNVAKQALATRTVGVLHNGSSTAPKAPSTPEAAPTPGS